MITVLIADDHTLVRKGLRMLLEQVSDVRVVGEASDGADALRQIEALAPDCVLMDLAMPTMGGLEAIRIASTRYPRTRIIALSMHADEAHVHAALSAGAAGYLLKGSETAELSLALHAVARGQTYLTPAVSYAVLAALGSPRPRGGKASALDSLTPRQREVLRLVAGGRTTKDIASVLSLSAKTVETHRAAIMQRLGIRDLAGLVRFAVKVGLVGTDL